MGIRHMEGDIAKWECFALFILSFFDCEGYLVVKVNGRQISIVTPILLK